MKRFKNLKVRSKLMLSFALMAVISIAICVVGLVSTLTLDGITTELKELQHESVGISGVLNAHYTWRQALTESVLTGREFTGSLDPRSCALGQWYDSEESQKMSDPELLNMLKKLDEPHDFVHNEAKTIVGFIQAGDLDAAQAYLEDVMFPKTAEVISILTNMQTRYAGIVEIKDEESIGISKTMEYVDIALIFLTLVICFSLALFISGLIDKPMTALAAFMNKAGSTGDITLQPEDMAVIGQYARIKDEIGQAISGCAAFVQHVTGSVENLETIANGDLSIEIELLSDSDVMGKSLKNMVNNLNHMFEEINTAAAEVSTGSKQIADGAQALAQGSTEQAASIEQLSASITQIAHKTKDNAEMAGKAANLANTIKGNAERGSAQMDEMMAAVQDINEAGRNIQKVIKVIDDIAFQTNILALNAAVEAARAGQHGKGFSVVAEEVRNLAAKSAEAAKDTGNMIQDSIDKAALGSRIAGETAESLNEIVSGIHESNQIAGEIARSSEEQFLGIEQINSGIDQVAQVVQQNSATAEESAAASEEMSGQSQMLEGLIAQFKLKGSAGNAALGAGRGSDRHRQLNMPKKYAKSGGDYGKY